MNIFQERSVRVWLTIMSKVIFLANALPLHSLVVLTLHLKATLLSFGKSSRIQLVHCVLPWCRCNCSCEICSILTLIGSWGRVHPNNCIDVNRKSSDKWNSMLKNCIHRKCGPMADKVKDAVVFLQNTPVGMCTYLFIAGNPPTINESNHFTKEITLLCSKLQFHQRTASFWQTMDGVSYGVELNKCSLLVFLLGRCNIVQRNE